MPTIAEFLAGHPLAYRSFDGVAVVATYHKAGRDAIGHLAICDAQGRRLASPVMGEHGAAQFHGSIAADPAARPLELA